MTHAGTDPVATELWECADRLLERATLPGILAHRVGPLAANRLRRLGRDLPEQLILEERAASLSMLTVVPLLERIRTACDGTLILIKGPEVSRLYPGSARRFGDVDIIADDAEAVYRSLLTAGFEEVDDPDFAVAATHHHFAPVRWPPVALRVEVHKSPYLPPYSPATPFREIHDARVPSALGIEGISAPTAAHHALLLAVHAWMHEPLHTLRDLLDIAAVAATAEEDTLRRTADAWGIGRMWRTTLAAIEALFYGGERSLPLRTWARHLQGVRERSILERHANALVHEFWERSAPYAVGAFGHALVDVLAPAPGETWGAKIGRVRRAVSSPAAPEGRRDKERRIEHDAAGNDHL